MCGIAGLLYVDAQRPVLQQQIASMCAALYHRGPDDQGIYLDGSFGMGIRRLAIIDLLTGHAPLSNEDGTVWVVQNGEIYNFLELRQRLERQGHRFRSNCDTEVIAHLYEEEGPACVRSLRGMFALALWDETQKTLLLARDRLGIKPLYYTCDGTRLLFGSELRALLAAGLAPELDLQALHDYLSLSYIPAPLSIVRGVSKLLPGHMLLCQRGQMRVERYWQVQPPEDSSPIDDDELVEELSNRLRESVQAHLVSDVPLGVFLSGGVDSSSVVALMREVTGSKIKTFSVGFPEKSFNELEQARLVAQRFDTEHHELMLSPKVAEVVPQLAHCLDEPFGDSSALPVFYLSRFARQSVTVALSGDGGDEVFAGYETYAAYRWAEAYKRLPRLLSQRIVPSLVHRLPVSHRRLSFDYKAKRFVEGALLPPARGHFWWKHIFSEEAKRQLYRQVSPDLLETFRIHRDYFAAYGAGDPLDGLLHVDLMVGLPDDMLFKVDRMSMAHSLEVRVPLLDHKIVEFMVALPRTVKLRGWQKKYLLKRAMAGKVPDRILYGKKKGFNVPIPSWLRQDLRQIIHDTLAPQRLQESGLWDARFVGRMIHEHEERRRDWSRNIWCLLIFQLWYDTYVKGWSQRGYMAAAHDSSGL